MPGGISSVTDDLALVGLRHELEPDHPRRDQAEAGDQAGDGDAAVSQRKRKDQADDRCSRPRAGPSRAPTGAEHCQRVATALVGIVSQRDASIGVSVKETNSEKSVAAAITSPNWRKYWPTSDLLLRLPVRIVLIQDPVSLETPVGDGESVYSDLIEDTKSDRPDTATAKMLRSRELAGALRRLSPRMRRVLALRFGLDGESPQTLEQVGLGLGITRERVRQLESRALRELRQAAPGLQLYLETDS